MNSKGKLLGGERIGQPSTVVVLKAVLAVSVTLAQIPIYSHVEQRPCARAPGPFPLLTFHLGCIISTLLPSMPGPERFCSVATAQNHLASL